MGFTILKYYKWILLVNMSIIYTKKFSVSYKKVKKKKPKNWQNKELLGMFVKFANIFFKLIFY